MGGGLTAEEVLEGSLHILLPEEAVESETLAQRLWRVCASVGGCECGCVCAYVRGVEGGGGGVSGIILGVQSKLAN